VKKKKMRKEFAIVAVVAVIMVSAAVAVANMSDNRGNVQRYEKNGITYFYDSIAESTISSLQADKTEICYDDGDAEHNFTIDIFPQADIGHAVLFTPPPKPWTLKKVRVYGVCNVTLSGVVFALEIWDNDSNLIYKLTDYSIAYFNTTSEWTEIDIPGINITSDFYVCIFERGSIYVGTDMDNPEMRSYVVIRDPKSRVKQEGINWMIRAVGS